MSNYKVKPNPFQKILAKQPELKELFSRTLNQFVAQRVGGHPQSERAQREDIKKAILKSINKSPEQ